MSKTYHFSILLVLTLLTVSAQAATNYWDSNGATPGAGAAPAGTWSTDAFWSTSPEGTSATTTWTTGDDAVFSAGTDATGEYTVTLGSATANSFRIEEGAVTLGGSGAVTLGTGTVTVEAGATLVTGNSARMSAVAGSRLLLRGGHKKCINTGSAGSFVDVDMVIELDGGGTISHTVVGTANLNIIQTASVISGTGPLIKEGIGVLAVASACTYSGPTIINDGELRIRTTANRLPTGTDAIVNTPGILNLNAVAQQIGSLAGNGLVGLSGATLTIGGTSNTTFSGTIRTTANAGSAGSTATGGNVTKQGAGVLTLSGANQFTGLLTLSAGGIIVDPTGSLCDPVCDVAVNGGSLSLNNTAQTIENLLGSGGTITLGPGHTLTINPVNANRSSTYSGAIVGNGSIVKIGTTTETLAGANTYSGPTTVSAGKLVTTTASTGAGSYSMANATTLGARVAAIGTSLNMSALTADASTMEFDLNRFGIPTAPIINVAGPITVNGNITVDVKGFTTTGNFTLLEYSGTRSGAGSFVLGTLPPRAAAILTDDTVNKKVLLQITAGTDSLIWVGDAIGHWDTNNGANLVWKLASDGTPTEYRENALQGDSVRFDDTAPGTNGIAIVTNVNPFVVVIDNSTINYSFLGNGKLTGIAALTKSGTAQLTIATTNDHSGGSTVNAGIVNAGTSSVFGTGKLTVNGGIIRSDGATARTLTMPTDLNGNVVLGDSSNIGDLTFSTGAWTITGGSRVISVDTINATISSVIGQDSPSRALTKLGSGTLSLTAANTFSGGVTHSAGTLRVNNNAALGAANSPVSYADGVTLSTTAGTARTLTYAHTINGNITIGQASGGNATLTLAGSVDLAGGTRTLNTVTNLTISGVISNGAIIKEGTATLLLGNAGNLYSGTTTVNAGLLSIDADATIGNGTGQLLFNGGNLNVTADRDNNVVANPITISSDAVFTTTSAAAAADCRFNSTSISIAPGRKLTLRNDGADGANDTFEVRFSGGGISIAEEIIIDNGATGKTRLNLFNTNTDPVQTFSGVISGNGSVNRSASVTGTGGTTIFSGANTYSGGTTLNGGTLLVNNTSGSGTGTGAVTVNSTGTLGGTGTVAGVVVVNSGGKIAPGTSVGTLTLQGGLNLSTNGTYAWELGALGANPGDFDLISIAAADLVLGGGSKISVNFTGTASSPHGGNPFWSAPRSWTVISLAGGSNPGASDFASVVGGIFTNGYFTTATAAGNIVLNFTPGAPPKPEVTSLTGAGTTNVAINFTTAIKGATYQVQYKNDLSDANWNILASLAAATPSATIIDTTSPAPQQRFYRIVLQ